MHGIDLNSPIHYEFASFRFFEKEECGNLGNQETDGHGLMMMANFAAWCAHGRSGDYVRDH